MVVRIVDGGLSTELKRLGFPAEDGDPLWTSRYLIKDPDALRKAHLRFLEQGADVILTGTYQASAVLFKKEADIGGREFDKLIHTGCQMAREAASQFWETNRNNGRTKPIIAGSVGPYGACLQDFSEYHGRYVDSMTAEELIDWHRPRINALVEAKVDLLALETIASIKEAEALLSILEEFPQMNAWISFASKDKAHIGHGETFAAAVSVVSKCPQVIAVGTNCCPAENVTALLQSASAERNGKPFIVYPNSPGEYHWTDNSQCSKMTAYEFDALIPAWIEAGATYIGGCCGTGAAEIKHLANVVRGNDK